MDIGHHALIGFAGALAGQTLGWDAAAAGFLVGSVAPDLDALVMVRGKLAYLQAHQGATHSVFVAPAIAAVPAAVVWTALGDGAVAAWAGGMAGILLHIGMDCLNTFGTRPFWPIRRRLAADAIFFVDLPTLAVTLWVLVYIAFGQPGPSGAAWASSVWLGFVGLYAAYKVAARLALRRRLGTDTEIPSGMNPFAWFVTRTIPGGVEWGRASALTGRARWTGRSTVADGADLALASASPTFRAMSNLLRRLEIVEVVEVGRDIRIVARCVAVPNFGNRYGEVTLEFLDGKLVGEHARL